MGREPEEGDRGYEWLGESQRWMRVHYPGARAVVRTAVAAAVKTTALAAFGLEGLVWLTAGLALWRLLAPDPLQVAGADPGDAPPTIARDATEQLRRLIATAPFGVATARAAQPGADPETLQLAGVMLAENSADSRAILRLASGEQRAFGVGEALGDGRRVSAVSAEAVHLQGPAGETLLPLHPRTDAVTEAVADAPEGEPMASNPTVAAPHGLVIDKREHASSREFLARLRADAARDPGVLAELINIEPEQGTEGAGLRIHSRNREALLARAGLESGDLVTEVNGVKLAGPLAGLAAAEALATADELTVKLFRNGSPITLKLKLGQPDQ